MHISREIHLVARPRGLPLKSDFALVNTQLPDLKEGQIRIKNQYLTVDPYMRGRMNDVKSYIPPFALNQVMEGDAIGEVVESQNDKFAVGEFVHSFCGWREQFTSDGRGLRKVDAHLAPLSCYLGILGMPGLTAYAGLLRISALKEGETVFVSGAAGAVGSLVGQIAKQKNCRVIGSAGSQEKIDYLTNECGFDYAFNYKQGDLLKSLQKGAPNGIDVYFDNVGGDHLQAALGHMRQYGRIACCGSIANYNATSTPAGPNNLWEVTARELTLRGFIVSSHSDMQADFVRDVGQWLKDGKIKYRETVYEGLDHMVDAFLGLFDGSNLGKMILKL